MSDLRNDVTVALAQARLVEQRVLRPVAANERARWDLCDLASLVENRLGIVVDVGDEPDAAVRDEWILRATDDGKLDRLSDEYRTPYWILDADVPVGTVAVSNSALVGGAPTLMSVYVFAAHRRRGHARRIVGRIAAEAMGAGLRGIWLDTSWCWQHAVKLYCGLGMWVRSWKRDLTFVWWRDIPRWTVEVDGAEACLRVDEGVVMTASRRGDRLTMLPSSLAEEGELAYLAPGTFAVALASRGWPLITSNARWRKQLDQGWSDFGGPEGLAFKIRRWEAWARDHGWIVDTPRIPGLAYPSWRELEES